MNWLNEETTAIFSRLMAQMGNNRTQSFKSKAGTYILLSRYSWDIRSEYGDGQLYHLAHLHRSLGKVSLKEGIYFIVIDRPRWPTASPALRIIPQRYENPDAGIVQESTVLQDDALMSHYPEFLTTHIVMAEQWLTHIGQQEYHT